MIPMPWLNSFARGILFFMALWPSALLAGSPVQSGSRFTPGSQRDSGFQIAAADKPAAKGEPSAEVKRLISATKEKGERELTLTWDEAALGGSSGAKKFEALFNRMYGLNSRVNFTPGPTMPAMAAKVIQEVAAGANASTDIFLGTELHCGPLLDRNALEAYDYTRLSSRIRKDMIEPKNMCVQVYSNMGGIIYNTNMIPPAEAPRKLEDVLNLKWKGRIASTPYAAYFDLVAMRPQWGIERMTSFMQRLSVNVGGLIRVNEVSRIISGEFVMLVLGSDQHVSLEKAKGAPLEFVVPEDGAAVHFLHMGVPRTSAHPNLSKLFINTLMSEEGQRILYDLSFSDHHELAGSRWLGTKLKELKTKGIEPLRLDLKFLSDHPEMQKVSTDLQKILLPKQ